MRPLMWLNRLLHSRISPEVALDGSAEDIQAWGDANGYSQGQIDDLIKYRRQANYYTYEDEVDNYGQDHQQLHLEHQLGDWRLSATGHFTHGAAVEASA